MRKDREPPTRGHPYGFHRSVGVRHLVAAVAMAAIGTFLVFYSATGLFGGEHPTTGTVVVFGQVVCFGWLMIGVMALIAVPPSFIGRAKMKLAQDLHNKVLYADADMKGGLDDRGRPIVGGVGTGLWWLDDAAVDERATTSTT